MNPPLRLHHYAWVTKDHEANRRFFEDVLGMPLIATWCERAYVAEVGRELEYCHAFYGLADGGAIAFFQFADAELFDLFKAQHPKQARFGHIALKVDRATFEDTERRLQASGTKFRVTDHGYCRSLYVLTPDELKLEYTLDPDNADEIAGKRRADAHAELKRWLAGDHHSNNMFR
jgi:catechol 2,3-dioxygenase-like lactoylglutathione lyase family enzyme